MFPNQGFSVYIWRRLISGRIGVGDFICHEIIICPIILVLSTREKRGRTIVSVVVCPLAVGLERVIVKERAWLGLEQWVIGYKVMGKRRMRPASRTVKLSCLPYFLLASFLNCSRYVVSGIEYGYIEIPVQSGTELMEPEIPVDCSYTWLLSYYIAHTTMPVNTVNLLSDRVKVGQISWSLPYNDLDLWGRIDN